MNEESQEQDIVQELEDWAFITDGVQGKAMMVMLSGEVFRDAAQEIKTLRTALALAVGELSTHREYRVYSPEIMMNQFLDEARKK